MLLSEVVPAITCIRCFAVFDSDDARPGVAPVCPGCAPYTPSISQELHLPSSSPAPRGKGIWLRLRRFSLLGVMVALVVGVALAGATGVRLLRRKLDAVARKDKAPAPRAVDEALTYWRSTGRLPTAPEPPRGPKVAEERILAGRAALAADEPARIDEALGDFREALAAAPESAEAAAGYAIALSEGGLDSLPGADIARAHDLVRDGLLRQKDQPHLLSAFARLLIAVPSARNLSEAQEVAVRAKAAAPGDPEVELSAGLSRLSSDPAAAASDLARAAVVSPGDLRLLSAAAWARWAAGDAAGALELARARLSKDPDHPRSLALVAEVDVAADRLDEAREVLARWAAAAPSQAEPLLLEAEIHHQLDHDLPAARRALASAMERKPDDFLAARILAHSAAVEREAGDVKAARAAVAEALRRVPASAPAQYQAALLAYEARDAKAFSEAAGTVGARAGKVAESQLAVRRAELLGEVDEAQRMQRAMMEKAVFDPSALLVVGGSLLSLRAPGAALEAAGKALSRDLVDARLRRMPTDFWEGPGPLASTSETFQALGRSAPRDPGAALSAAAACELLLGHARAAEGLAQLAEAAEPQSPAPVWLLAQAELDLSQPARALPLARQAVEMGEADAAAQATLGRALEASGKPEEAEGAYRAALSSVPDLVAVRLALARILARRGEAEAGRALLKAVRHDAPDVLAVRRALMELGEGGPVGSH